jgi:tetratricopeptide (TPR) repeat protein
MNEKKSQIDKLIEEASEVLRTDTKYCLELSQKAYDLATQMNYTQGIADSLWHIGASQERLSEFDAALSNLQKALELYDRIDDQKGKANTLLRIGAIHIFIGPYQKAIHFLEESAKNFQKIGDRNGENAALCNIGITYDKQEYFDIALQYYIPCLKTAEELNDEFQKASLSLNIGIVYFNLENFSQALEFFENSLKSFEKLGDKRLQSNALKNIGSVYSDMGDPEKGLEFFKSSLKLREEIGDIGSKGYILTDIGKAYYDLNKYDKALSYLFESKEILDRLGNPLKSTENLLSIGKSLFKKNESENALSYLEKALNSAETYNFRNLLYHIYDTLREIYKKKDDFENSLYYYDKFHKIYQEMFEADYRKKIRELQIKFEVERKENENKILQLKIENQKNELSLYLKHLAEKNDLIRILQEEILELRKGKNPNHKDVLNSVLSHLKSRNINEEWHLFQDEFDKIYPNFLSRLTDQYPDLTRQEIRVCVLIKIDLSTKEIANVLYVHPKSVEKYRTRIRRKLGLLREVGLSEFIRAF